MDWLTILSTVFGSTAFTSIIGAFLYRRATKRLKNAEAVRAEVAAESDRYAVLERRCIFNEEQLRKADERDADKTAQIRELNGKLLDMERKYAELHIDYVLKRCDRARKCAKRVPPNKSNV